MLTLPALRHSLAATIAAPLLVLLFVLMPVSTMCRPWVPLMSPLAAAVPLRETERDLVLSVRFDGMLLVGQTYVRPGELCDALQSAFERAPDRPVILQIDRRSPFASTREMLTALQRLGIAHVTLRSSEHARPPADGRN